MKIVDVSVARYERPYERPISNGKYTYTHAHFVVVELRTDEGITGVGWTDGGKVVQEAVDLLRPALLGGDPFAVERIWSRMYRPKIVGRKGLELRAISAVDIALWDLMGKATGQPVAKLLGGYSDRVRVYIAGGYYEEGKGIVELCAEMERYLKQGAKAVKMKIGLLDIKEDLQRVRAVREAIGPDVDLLVDANNAYTANQAIRMGRYLDEMDIFWFEEPVSPDNIPAHAEVAAALDVPIAAGENEYTQYGFRDLIAARAVDVLNPDAKVMGGITPWRKVALMAEAHDLPVAPHGAQEVHVHLAAAFPNGLILEYYNPNTMGLAAEMFEETLPIVDGYAPVPDRPGLGFTLNRRKLEQYRVG